MKCSQWKKWELIIVSGCLEVFDKGSFCVIVVKILIEWLKENQDVKMKYSELKTLSIESREMGSYRKYKGIVETNVF